LYFSHFRVDGDGGMAAESGVSVTKRQCVCVLSARHQNWDYANNAVGAVSNFDR
jgi:hypothetical protein